MNKGAASGGAAAGGAAAGGAAAEGGGGGRERRVEVLVLPEVHTSQECTMRNSLAIAKKLQGLSETKGYGNAKLNDAVLVFSEGREFHPCYQMLQFRKENALMEYDPEQTPLEMIGRFILLLEYTERFILGIPSTGPFGMPMVPPIVSMMALGSGDNIKPLLAAIPNGEKIFNMMVEKAYAQDARMYNILLKRLLTEINTHYLAGGDEQTAMLRGVIETVRDTETEGRTPAYPKGARAAAIDRETERINGLRDAIMIQRIRARVAADPRIELVIMIVGRMHYPNLTRLVRESADLVLAPEMQGGRRRRKSRRRGIRRSNSRRRRN